MLQILSFNSVRNLTNATWSIPQGLEFDVEPSCYDESKLKAEDFPSPGGYAEQLAYEKAAEVT